MSDPTIARFFRCIVISSECWEWMGAVNRKGYGAFKGPRDSANFGRQKNYLAHRFSWFVVHGNIPDEMCVCHRCDNPRCVRPDHLFLGTNDDNVADKVSKGRQSRGNRNPRARLTDVQVVSARACRAAGHSVKRLSLMLGIPHNTMSQALRGVTYAHLPGATQ